MTCVQPCDRPDAELQVSGSSHSSVHRRVLPCSAVDKRIAETRTLLFLESGRPAIRTMYPARVFRLRNRMSGRAFGFCLLPASNQSINPSKGLRTQRPPRFKAGTVREGRRDPLECACLRVKDIDAPSSSARDCPPASRSRRRS